MQLGEIYTLMERLRNGEISQGELLEIDEAFDELVARGVELRDLPENATAKDKLEELEAHAPKVEVAIYQWVVDHFGESEANDPSWNTALLAQAINSMNVIGDGPTGKLGFLLGDLTEKEAKEI